VVPRGADGDRVRLLQFIINRGMPMTRIEKHGLSGLSEQELLAIYEELQDQFAPPLELGDEVNALLDARLDAWGEKSGVPWSQVQAELEWNQ
jgi:hypothetical protein